MMPEEWPIAASPANPTVPAQAAGRGRLATVRADFFLDPSERLSERLVTGRSSQPVSPIESLTDREVEVFEHFGRGRTTAEIAGRLGLSAKTVESHRANIRRKLGVTHAPEFAQRAVLYVERSLSSAAQVPAPL